MLKQRVITASILAPLVVWAVLESPTPYLALVFGVLIVQGGWEWSGFMKLASTALRVSYPAVVGGALLAVWFFVDWNSSDWLVLPVLSLFWWLLALLWVLGFPRSARRWSPRWAQTLIGLLVLVPSWLSVVGLHQDIHQGPALLLYLLLLIWCADIGAYFGGRRWGRRKLAPAVSPGKSWEGAYSALAASLVFALLGALFFGLPGNQLLALVVLSLVTVAFSILGDLTESMFKRHAGIKDSGVLLPGHGGVLDRIDSITAAAPVFVVGLWLFDFQHWNLV